MEKLKINFKEKLLNKDFLKLAFKNLGLIVFIIIFVILFSTFFGTENQLIGVALITGLLLFRKVGIGIDVKQAPFVIFVICMVIAICNLLSYINIYLAILINAIAVFTLMIFSTIRLQYKTYITFILFYIFAYGSAIPEGRWLYRISAFVFSGLLLAIIHFIYNKNNETCKKVSEIFSEFNLQNESYVFTLKMTIGITIAMLFSDMLGLAKGMWISITVMSLTQPEFEISKNRIIWRISGTLIGALIYFALFEHILPESSIIFITFILSYIYTFIKSYHIQIIFITINSLNAAKEVFDSGHPIIFRISFLFLGIIIALIVIFLENKFLNKRLKPICEEQTNFQEEK